MNTLIGAADAGEETVAPVVIEVFAPKSEVVLCTGVAAIGTGLPVPSAFLPNKEVVPVPKPVVSGVDIEAVGVTGTLADPPKRPLPVVGAESAEDPPEAAMNVDVGLLPNALGAADGIGG